MSSLISDNPFATCFTRPGEIPFLFEDAGQLESLTAAFVRSQYLGQIVGPHGCGKTTLCHMIANELHSVFPTVDYIAIRSGYDLQTLRYTNSSMTNSSMDSSTNDPGSDDGPTLTIVDGIERLSLLQQRMMISNLTRRKGSRLNQAAPQSPELAPLKPNGLLFTSHRRIKFVPFLFSIAPSLATFIRVARYLDPSLKMTEDELANLFAQANQNCREAIMLLYDRHELA